ncbi:MAG: tetratricopeptide repeat protein [Candidatus Binatia bacterium]
MDSFTFWIVVLFGAFTLYRLISRRVTTPKSRVTAMLRQYHAFERTGLSEQESLLRLLATRRGWKNLPHRFLAEIVSRLRSKEDVMRFVSVSEDYRYNQEHYPSLAARTDLNEALSEIACLWAKFGYGLQANGRLKEAEFVQKLALQLQPDRYFTNLPLAATYCETGRYTDALPLFEQGLAQLEKFSKGADPEQQQWSLAKCLDPDADAKKLRNGYKKMYETCLKATEGKSISSVYVLMILDTLYYYA